MYLLKPKEWVFYSQEECLVSVCGLLVKPMSGTHVFIAKASGFYTCLRI